MKISEKLNLTKSQFELDFVDIDTERNIPLFIDSNLIRKYDSEFNANVPSGFFWNEKTLKWENEYMDRLIIDDKPILFP